MFYILVVALRALYKTPKVENDEKYQGFHQEKL